MGALTGHMLDLSLLKCETGYLYGRRWWLKCLVNSCQLVAWELFCDGRKLGLKAVNSWRTRSQGTYGWPGECRIDRHWKKHSTWSGMSIGQQYCGRVGTHTIRLP